MTMSKDRTTALGACPFCGGEAARQRGDDDDRWWVECQRCGARTAAVLDGEDADDRWNLRA